MKNIPLKTFQEFSRDFIGVPYASFDCWDIVKIFYKKVLSKDISLGLGYSRKGKEDHKDWAEFSELLINENKSKFKKVGTPRFGDIVLLKIYGIPAHLGVYINETQILHTSESTGCMIDRLSRWKSRVEGFYRHEE